MATMAENMLAHIESLKAERETILAEMRDWLRKRDNLSTVLVHVLDRAKMETENARKEVDDANEECERCQEKVDELTDRINTTLNSENYRVAVLERAVNVERSLWDELTTVKNDLCGWEVRAESAEAKVTEQDALIVLLRGQVEKYERMVNAYQEGKGVIDLGEK